MTTTPLELVLTAMELEVFSIVRDAGVMGIAPERLEGALYDHMLDPPLTARNAMYVHINNANKKLALFGLKIAAINRRYLVLSLRVAPKPRQRVIRGRRMWAF
jgi:hypothetical protein